MDLRSELDVAVAAATEAADLLMAYFHGGVASEEKGDRDLVSDADRISESLVARHIAAAFPEDVVVGEEGTGAQTSVSGRRRWYVDPLDGTTNFLKGLDEWGVSVALCDAEDVTLVGTIVMPRKDAVFTATRGGGARRNGVRIHASHEGRVDRLLATYAMSHARPGEGWGSTGDMADAFLRLGAVTLGTRMQGCAVAALTAVAMGTIDMMWAGGLSAWDVAAGLLIAGEAGAAVTDPSGDAVVTPATAFLATPVAVHDAIRAIIDLAGT